MAEHTHTMRLVTYLAKRRVKVLDAATKEEALQQMLALFQESPSMADHAAFADAIWQREEVLPTGLGLGIGVPHARTPAVRHPAAALAVFRSGIPYGSLDKLPVRLILMIGMPENTQNEYLLYLAKAAQLFRKPDFRECLLACGTDAALWEAVEQV